ncbi:MAG: zinc ribbon domain-containing protein [Bacteroidota bacterium]|nr:zinc ribbon domain-containing protein [Bacteroidota bacterium]
MEPKIFCQSCTMPIDNMEDRGTEKDGSKSSEYCKYCYQHGSFTDPGMTLDKMKNIVTTQMQKMNLPASLLQQSLDYLPRLKRWQKA